MKFESSPSYYFLDYLQLALATTMRNGNLLGYSRLAQTRKEGLVVYIVDKAWSHHILSLT